MIRTAVLLVLPALLAVLAAATYTGSYAWLDVDEDAVQGRTLSMVLTEADDGYRAEFTANFGMEHSKMEWMRERKDYTYAGDLTRDGDRGPLVGRIEDEQGKMVWEVRIKFSGSGEQATKAIGIAQEVEGHRSWGTFRLVRQEEEGGGEAE